VLRALDAERVLLDWGGGLIWAGESRVRAAHVRACLAPGSHATLVKAPAVARDAVTVFQPRPPALAALATRVKAAFDPRGLLNPGRMG
jgi:glycolate oxidase FAD binding subunit